MCVCVCVCVRACACVLEITPVQVKGAGVLGCRQ